jgi:hypothetical protein
VNSDGGFPGAEGVWAVLVFLGFSSYFKRTPCKTAAAIMMRMSQQPHPSRTLRKKPLKNVTIGRKSLTVLPPSYIVDWK